MKSKHVEGLVFIACILIGAGVGMAFGKTAVGGTIGTGVGFLAMAILRLKAKKSESRK